MLDNYFEIFTCFMYMLVLCVVGIFVFPKDFLTGFAIVIFASVGFFIALSVDK